MALSVRNLEKSTKASSAGCGGIAYFTATHTIDASSRTSIVDGANWLTNRLTLVIACRLISGLAGLTVIDLRTSQASSWTDITLNTTSNWIEVIAVSTLSADRSWGAELTVTECAGITGVGSRVFEVSIWALGQAGTVIEEVVGWTSWTDGLIAFTAASWATGGTFPVGIEDFPLKALYSKAVGVESAEISSPLESFCYNWGDFIVGITYKLDGSSLGSWCRGGVIDAMKTQSATTSIERSSVESVVDTQIVSGNSIQRSWEGLSYLKVQIVVEDWPSENSITDYQYHNKQSLESDLKTWVSLSVGNRELVGACGDASL